MPVRTAIVERFARRFVLPISVARFVPWSKAKPNAVAAKGTSLSQRCSPEINVLKLAKGSLPVRFGIASRVCKKAG